MALTAERFFREYGVRIARCPKEWRYRPWINNFDIPIDDPAIRRKFRCCGLHYPGYMSGVLYQPGYITYVPLHGCLCGAISYQFSGCYMVKLCFRGQWYAMHVSTADRSSACYDTRTVWWDFLNRYQNDITRIAMIQPNKEPPYQQWLGMLPNTHGVTVAGLFDGNSRGYSLLFDTHTCKVVNDSDQNIVVACKCLSTRDIDRLTYLRKTI